MSTPCPRHKIGLAAECPNSSSACFYNPLPLLPIKIDRGEEAKNLVISVPIKYSPLLRGTSTNNDHY